MESARQTPTVSVVGSQLVTDARLLRSLSIKLSIDCSLFFIDIIDKKDPFIVGGGLCNKAFIPSETAFYPGCIGDTNVVWSLFGWALDYFSINGNGVGLYH